MNIADLQPGSYTPVNPSAPQAPQTGAGTAQPLNINNLPPGSYTPVQPQEQPSVGGFIGNAIGSVGNLVGGVANAAVNVFNPDINQNTLANIGKGVAGAGEEFANTVGGTNYNDPNTQKWDAIVQNYKQAYGSPENFVHTLYTDPARVAADASALLGGAGAITSKIGALGEAGAAADAVRAGDVIAMGGRTAEGAVATPAMTAASKVGAGLSAAGEAVNPFNVITKPVGALANSDFLGNTVKGGFSQVTGIQPSDIETITKNPDEFTPSAMANYNRSANADIVNEALTNKIDSLQETGAGYKNIRATEGTIPVPPDYLKNLIAEKTGLIVEGDGTAAFPYKLKATGDSSIRTPGDVSALQAKIMNVWEPEFAKGSLTPNQFLNFRSDLAKMAKYEGGIGKSSDLENLASVMRGKLNSDFRGKIPTLAETDAKFAAQARELHDLRQNILNKDNTLNPNAVNRIANALGKGKDEFLARLEELSPGITKKIAIGKAIENIQALKGNVVGTYGRTAGTISAAAAGLSGGPMGAVVSAVVEHIMTSPSVAVPLLKAIGKSSPLYQAILAKFNVATPALIAAQVNRLNQEAKKPKSVKVRTPKF